MSEEKYIFNRAQHLGSIRHSVNKGTIVRYDEDAGTVRIGSKSFDDDTDIIISIRHNWLKPYSVELEDAILGSDLPASTVQEVPVDKRPEIMKVIRHDQDLIDEIDISNTKNLPKTHIKPQHNANMEVIKAEEHTRELPDEAVSKQAVELREGERQVRGMTVISEDDAEVSMPLGIGYNKNEIPLNAGQVRTISAEENARTKASAAARATANKKQLNKNRADDHPDKVQRTSVTKTSANKKGRGRPKGSKNKKNNLPSLG